MNAFIALLQELMAPWAPVQARRMFGGYGLYREGLMFALVADDVLYMKVDDANEPQFRAAGSRPFVYEGKGRTMVIRYFTVPAECFESPAVMSQWCALGWAAALRGQHAAPKRVAGNNAPTARKRPVTKPAAKRGAKRAAKRAAARKTVDRRKTTARG